jgi:hypothetical protein
MSEDRCDLLCTAALVLATLSAVVALLKMAFKRNGKALVVINHS